ncbi:GspE/PulE family protein [Thalassobaculum litoreum]|nr:ATPase, T2SS/T4P/T4SS family [Thalassobaculum litoreum]
MTSEPLLPDMKRARRTGRWKTFGRSLIAGALTRARRTKPNASPQPEGPSHDDGQEPQIVRPVPVAVQPPPAKSPTTEFLDALVSTQQLSADRADYISSIVKEHQLRGRPATAAELVIHFGFVPARVVLDLIQSMGLQMPLPADAAALYSLWPASLLAQLRVKPIRLHNGTLYIAAVRPLLPFEEALLIDRAKAGDVVITQIVQEPQETVATLAAINTTPHTTGQQLTDLLARHDIAATPDALGPALDSLLTDALENGASDIHIEVHDNLAETRIEYRVANGLNHRASVSPQLGRRLAVLIRERAGIDTSNLEALFDGDFRFRYHGRPIDIRVAILPTHAQQKLTLRLSDPSAFQSLPAIFEHFPEFVKRLEHDSAKASRRGSMGIVTGATNQGKSTTLRAFVMNMPRHALRVLEAGEPIEVKTPLTTQTHINRHADVGLTFDAFLRAALRHDPDVVFAQELRDEETIRAALRIVETGHMFLSSLHADSVVDTFPRLFSFIHASRAEAAFVLSRGLSWIIHQVLISTPCRACSTTVPTSQLPEDARTTLGLEDDVEVVSLNPAGCPECRYQGYGKQRTVVPAGIWINASARQALHQHLSRIVADGHFADYDQILAIPGIDYFPRGPHLQTLAERHVIAWQTAVHEINWEANRGH